MNLSEEITVSNKMGLHIRPLARIAGLSQTAVSRIYIIKDGQSADAASIIDMLLLACTTGSRIRVGVEDLRDSDIMDRIIAFVQK